MGQSWYVCKLCDSVSYMKIFLNKIDLDKHLLVDHNNENRTSKDESGSNSNSSNSIRENNGHGNNIINDNDERRCVVRLERLENIIENSCRVKQIVSTTIEREKITPETGLRQLRICPKNPSITSKRELDAPILVPPSPIQENHVTGLVNEVGLQSNIVKNEYPCQYCPSSFKYFNQLWRHLRSHDLGNPGETCSNYAVSTRMFGSTTSTSDVVKISPVVPSTQQKQLEDQILASPEKFNNSMPILFPVDEIVPKVDVQTLQTCMPFLSPEVSHENSNSHEKLNPKNPNMSPRQTYRKHKKNGKKVRKTQVSQSVPSSANKIKSETTHRDSNARVLLHPLSTAVLDQIITKMEARALLPNRNNVVKRNRPYACDKCDKTYITKVGIEGHKRFHENERPYTCKYCQSGFSHNWSLRYHIRVHHEYPSLRPFSCDDCGKKFKSKMGLEGHQKSHSGELPFICQRCGTKFMHESGLVYHVRAKHSTDMVYSCKYCSRKFPDRTTWISHTRIHTGQTPYKCNNCGIEFKHHAGRSYHFKKNPDCAKSGGSKSNLKFKVKSESGSKNARCCEICFKTFRTLRGLTSHRKFRHKKEKSYSCKYCDEIFKTFTDLVHHEQLHPSRIASIQLEPMTDLNLYFNEKETEIKDSSNMVKSSIEELASVENTDSNLKSSQNLKLLACDTCRHAFDTKEAFEFHKKYKTKCGPNNFQDSIQDKILEGGNSHPKINLNQSRKILTGKECKVQSLTIPVNNAQAELGNKNLQLIRNKKKLYLCTYCPKRLTTSEGLRYHTRTHTGESLHECSYCGKSFSRSESLSNHMRLHTGQTPFKCKICDKAYASQAAVATHAKSKHGKNSQIDIDINPSTKKIRRRKHNLQLITTKKQPYLSTYSPKRLTTAKAFKIQTRIHTGEMPFACPYCGRSFRRLDHLNNHARLHTGQRPFKCKVCDKAYPSLSAALTHTARVHTKSYECVLCNESFGHYCELIKHMRKNHTREKDFYECKNCGKCFADNKKLRNHYNKTHK